ncbi:MAG: hypothetical protein AVDCRST_MAG32-234, partial [uncultured Nocardioides sp.]
GEAGGAAPADPPLVHGPRARHPDGDHARGARSLARPRRGAGLVLPRPPRLRRAAAGLRCVVPRPSTTSQRARRRSRWHPDVRRARRDGVSPGRGDGGDVAHGRAVGLRRPHRLRLARVARVRAGRHRRSRSGRPGPGAAGHRPAAPVAPRDRPGDGPLPRLPHRRHLPVVEGPRRAHPGSRSGRGGDRREGRRQGPRRPGHGLHGARGAARRGDRAGQGRTPL